ncbi:MAG: hypothetical protein ABI967_16580 [bacterium]
MKKSHKLPAWLSGSLIVGAFGALLSLERRRPLRHSSIEPKLTRDARNLAVAALGAAALQIAERHVFFTDPMAYSSPTHGSAPFSVLQGATMTATS